VEQHAAKSWKVGSIVRWQHELLARLPHFGQKIHIDESDDTHLHAHTGMRVLLQPIEQFCDGLLRLNLCEQGEGEKIKLYVVICGTQISMGHAFILSCAPLTLATQVLTKAGKPYLRGRYSSMNSCMDFTLPFALASISSWMSLA